MQLSVLAVIADLVPTEIRFVSTSLPEYSVLLEVKLIGLIADVLGHGPSTDIRFVLTRTTSYENENNEDPT